MVDSWANVKDVLDTEVPGEPSAGIFVYYDTESDWSDGISDVVKGAFEERPR